VGICITYVDNKHTEEQGSQEILLRYNGENLKRRGQNTRDTNLDFPENYDDDD
jgi:hypothetical protein